MGSRRNQSFAVDTRLLLVQGVAAARAGESSEARRYLERLLRAGGEPEEIVEACLWLSHLSSDEAEKRHYLEEILARRPGEPRARRALAILDGRLQPEEIVDPERLHPAEAAPLETTGRRFSCPRCASRLVFTPDGAALHCEHCGYRHLLEQAGAIGEQDFVVTMARDEGHRQPVGLRAFTCQGCAAPFLLGPASLTFTCPYCDATYALGDVGIQSLVPPDAIIPFALTEAAAQKAVDGWLRAQRLPGRALAHPLYLPLWTFDVGGAIHWSGYRQQYRGAAPFDAERPAFVPEREEGDYAILLDDYPVPACKTLPSALHPLLQQFSFAAAVPFDPDYLANWPAQTYQVTVGDASLQARRAAFQQHEELVRRSLARLQQLHLSPAHIDILSYKLLLVPIWLGHYDYRSTRYAVAVNGQTGAVLGEQPAPGLRRWLARPRG
jgi:DNA-directed RNA polymerase subunit RPC12/RpoP